MNQLQLIPLSQDDPQAVCTFRQLMIGVGDVPIGCAVVSPRIVEQQLLSSLHVLSQEEELWETVIGRPRLTRANPFLNEAALGNLDDDGLIREGTRVNANDVLASIVVADLRTKVRGQARPEKGMQWVTDRSLQVPSGWKDAVVASAQRITRNQFGPRSPRGLLERIEITLQAVRPLQMGDVICVADQPLVVTSVIEQPPRDRQGQQADLLVPPSVAAALGISADRFVPLQVAKTDDRAAESLQARSVGPYSLISQQPLAKPPYGGQLITEAHVAWLAERGLSALVGELVSLKSDNVFDRARLHSLVDEPAGSVLDLHRPAAPESLAEIRAYLLAFGLHVELRDDHGHVSIRTTLAGTNEIVRQSAGQVTKPETLNYRTLEETDDGLFAPNIFGPSNWSRRQKLGHLKLAAPIVSMLGRIGTPSLLSRATELTDDDIERVVNHQADVVWQDGEATLIDRALEGDPAAPNHVGTGATAIRAILAAKSASGLPAELSAAVAALTLDALPVLPPDWRPLVLLDSGNYATSDLNDLYRLIINRNNRLAKLRELNAPQVILDNDARSLQETVDTLFANSLVPEAKAVFGTNGRRLVDILLLALGKIAKQEKRVDWSGAARLLADHIVPHDHVLVPREMFETLRLEAHLPLLLTIPSADGCFVARFPIVHNQLVLRVSPATYDALVGSKSISHGGYAHVAQVHRPVTAAGVAEALRLLGESPSRKAGSDGEPSDSWIDSESMEDLVTRLVSAAMSAEWTPLDGPRGLLLGGTGSTQFAEDKAIEQQEQRRQVAIPEDAPPRTSEPTFEDMLAVARRHLLRTCVFEVRQSDESPPAGLGRIGGEPYLPPDIEWPRFRGKPLPFLGQFPLDAARDGGVLPIDVPAGSMLTVFGGDDCWEPGPCGERCPVFIHALDNLTPRPIPDELDDAIELCAITPRIADELPDWSELEEILNWELGNPKPKLLREFRTQYLQTLPATVEGVKLGGWPKWIQSPDSSEALLLQLASVDDADLMFGDCGTLYIVVDKGGGLSCFVQCY